MTSELEVQAVLDAQTYGAILEYECVVYTDDGKWTDYVEVRNSCFQRKILVYLGRIGACRYLAPLFLKQLLLASSSY